MIAETVFDSNGYTCFISMDSKAYYRSGYVVVPPDHPVLSSAGGGYGSIMPSLDVHGGISYVRRVCAGQSGATNESLGADVVPPDGATIIGFDCGHAFLGDAPDRGIAAQHGFDDLTIRCLMGFIKPDAHSWSEDDVRMELSRLTAQLSAMCA